MLVTGKQYNILDKLMKRKKVTVDAGNMEQLIGTGLYFKRLAKSEGYSNIGELVDNLSKRKRMKVGGGRIKFI